MLPFTQEELQAAIDAGRVSERWHPTLPYRILNYTPEIQYSNSWDRVTRACRGLILDDKMNIVARPYEKFFNLGQVDLPFQFNEPVEIMDKADGSLGIMYPVPVDTEEISDVFFAIATRGSFESEQAKMASLMFADSYSHLMPMAGYTMLFEIVGPDNRIVLEYPENDLILLGAVENDRGYYLSPLQAKSMWIHRETKEYTEWSGKVIEVMNFDTLTDALGHMERSNAEGYVVRHHNFMVKLKQPDYIDLHAIVTNLSEKKVWEHLRDGKFSHLLDVVPDEWHGWLNDVSEKLRSEYFRIEDEIFAIWTTIKTRTLFEDMSRKDFAILVTKEYKAHAKYLFLAYDNKFDDMNQAIWQAVKPKGE